MPLLPLIGGLGGCQGASATDGAGDTIGTSTEAVSSCDDGSQDNDLQNEALQALAKPARTDWTSLDDKLIGPVWSGTDAKGAVISPLFRGGFPGMEDYIFTPANGDCTKMKSTIRVDWDQAANKVTYTVKGINFPVMPTVTRTEGVNYFSDPFHNAAKDIHGGAYRLWILLGSTTNQTQFFYDPTTLQLLGSTFDFTAASPPPANAIPATFPIFSTTGSNQFDPDSHGNVLHQFTLPYTAITNESATFARAFASFVPLDLCEAKALQPAVSQLRPYVTPWQPISPAPVWSDMLHAGIGFSIQLDDRVPLNNGFGGNLPYVYSGIDVMSNLLSTQGGIPNGWGNQIIAAIMNVAPILAPVPNGNGRNCQPYVQEPTHVTKPLYCQGQN
ncbi:MAG TPA: hypothetical protein VH044_05660 [Polyangiaceae bacterium]|nr:hypothetical protein [Polyangiaceae bacterium]